MQTNYNLSQADIWSMSWRRFSVLFFKLFQWTDDLDDDSLPSEYDEGGSRRDRFEQAVHEARGADASVSRSFDWDKALGREPADSVEFLTTEELLTGSRSVGGKKVET